MIQRELKALVAALPEVDDDKEVRVCVQLVAYPVRKIEIGDFVSATDLETKVLMIEGDTRGVM